MTKWRNDEILCNMCSCLCTVLAVSVLYFKKKHWNRLRENSKIRHFVISSHLFYWHANHIKLPTSDMYIRYLSRFFDCWAHETTYAYIGNKHFFTKSCHCQTYQNSKISWQKMPIFDFQSDFSMSKIIQIFLKKFFIEEYQFRGTYIVIGIFWKLQFLKPFISKIKHIFCQLILEFW